MMEKGSISIIISALAVIVSIASLVWSVITDNRNRATKEKISLLEGNIKKGNYVSKVVFDKIFEQFQAISNCLFDNYNNVNVKLYPLIEQVVCKLPTEEKIKKMTEYYVDSENDFNKLIRLMQTNRFLLTEDMLALLKEFEKIIKELCTRYIGKIKDVEFNNSAELVTVEDEIELSQKAEKTLEIYNQITNSFKVYIENLQVI